MQTTLEIPQPWRGHIATLREGSQRDAFQILQMRGQIALIEKDIERLVTQQSFNQREINNLVVSLAVEAEIDNPVLSADCTQITGDCPPKE